MRPVTFNQREILSRIAGVWRGTYVTLSLEGDVLDGFRSRQEISLDGDRVYVRVFYFKDPERPEVLDFTASFDHAGELGIDDEKLAGHLYAPKADQLIFEFGWKDEPRVLIVETQTLRLPDRKFRLWQRFDGTDLESITVIRERRVPDETPERWW